jgi:nicotinamidase-related amidase
MADARANALSHGRLGAGAAHLCVDMQTVFAERTDWHVPWMERVLPRVLQLACAKANVTVFTRFVPPLRPEECSGAWRRYFTRWRHLTREQMHPELIALLPPLRELVPPGEIIDKQAYSPFTGTMLHRRLQERGVDTLVISGAETDVCVLCTVLGAVDLGYRIVIAADAVCSVSDATHDALMLLYRDRFAEQIEVASTEAILDAWN